MAGPPPPPPPPHRFGPSESGIGVQPATRRPASWVQDEARVAAGWRDRLRSVGARRPAALGGTAPDGATPRPWWRQVVPWLVAAAVGAVGFAGGTLVAGGHEDGAPAAPQTSMMHGHADGGDHGGH